MKVYDAIYKMRELTKENKNFSFSFLSYSITRNETHGIINIRRARLASRPPKDKNKYNEHMLTLLNLDTLQEFQIWQPLLMYFEGNKLTL